MITNHYYLKPTEHVRRSTAASVSYSLASSWGLTAVQGWKQDTALDSLAVLIGRRNNNMTVKLWTKSQQWQQWRQRSKKKNLFLKGILIIEDRTQTVNPFHHCPSPSLFPLVLAPKTNRLDLVFIPQLVTLCSGVSYRTAVVGLSLTKAVPNPCPLQGTWSWPPWIPLPAHSPLPLAFSNIQNSAFTANDESNRTRLSYFIISSFNRVVSFTCYHSHLEVLHFENIFFSGWKMCFWSISAWKHFHKIKSTSRVIFYQHNIFI